MIKLNTTRNASYKRKKNNVDITKISTTRRQYKNEGGLLGGLGYVGGSFAAGVAGIGEGIIDLGAAAIAALGGDTEYAKYVFKDNVVGDWHQSLTEDYNPGGFNKFVGDVFQGLGQSSVMLIPYAGPWLFFAGVGSQGISGAAAKTGDVGFKEVAYGVTSGAIEGGLEYVLGAAGKGAKSIGSAIAKGSGKTAVKSMVGGAVRKGLASKVLSSAAGEFLEESASEIIDVGLQKMYRIDPNAQLSGKDILYSGVVGAFSGGIMGGTVETIQTLNHRAAGQRIIRDGNSQTLVNTATSVANKLAGQGTNFKKAPEWVKTLRGEVDAYNKLVEKGKQNSASGETILGEMKASLFFAETQAIHFGVTEAIKTSSEENRATLAEYVNQTIEKKKRPRNYTADDIAKDTDGITMQLGIMQMASDTFINYADALASLEADQAQESAIGDVINKTRAEKNAADAEQQSDNVRVAPPITNVETKATSGIFNARAAESENSSDQSVSVSVIKRGESVIGNGEIVAGDIKNDNDTKYSLSKTKAERLKTAISELGNKRIRKQAGDKKITIQTDDYTVNKNIYSDKGRKKVEVNARIKNIENFEQLLNQSEYVETDTNIRDIEKDAKKGVVAIHKFKTSIEGYDIEFLVRDKGKNQYLYEAKFIENKKGSQQSIANGVASPAPNGDVENNKSIPQNEIVVNTIAKNSSKRDLVSNSSQNSFGKIGGVIAGGLAQKSTEDNFSGRATETAPDIRSPKEALTDVQRQERAAERAQKLIEREKEATPTVKELNAAREAVKDFDNMPQATKASVVKMIRSAESKVDSQTVRGLSNLMTLRRRSGALVMPDVEIRFADIGENSGGLYTHVGEGENKKTVILVNPTDSFKKTIRGTIAHEVVHYIENKKGYRELADYVLKTAKAEKITEIEAEYDEHYKSIYTAEAEAEGLTGDAAEKKAAERMATEEYKELIKSEVVAKLIGLRLNNEKFLKKYATKDDAMIKKIFRFLSASVNHLKDKDKATADEVTKLVNMFDGALKGNVVSDGGEKTGTAFDVNSSSDKQQEAIENNIKNVKQMPPVANISGEEFKKSEVDLVTQVSDFFDDQGNVATSLELGEVTFDRRGVKDDIAHGIGRKKAASFAAVPDVIKNGKVVDYQKNWKGRGYDTAVIAAPIKINGEPHLMGIVLIKEQGNQRFYVHEVLSIAEGAPLFKTGAITNNGDSGSDAPSVISILQKIAVVNSSDEKKDLTRANLEKMQVTDKRDLAEKKSKKTGEKPSEEKRGTARKSATVVSEYAGRYAREFGLNAQASQKIAAELEAIEKAFVEGGEGYFQEYRARVENIWKIIRKDGVFELVADDGVYGELSRYMFRRKFRVDKEYRRQMGNEWKSIYKALRGRIAADSNTKYQHIDSFYASLSESFPGLFPEDIVNVHDQLNRIAEVLAEVKDTHTAAFSFDQLPYNMQSAIGSDIIEMATSYVTRIESNRDVVTRLRSENAELIRALRKERSIREQMAREAAQAARDERVEVFEKKDIELATKIIEGWSRDEIMSLTKGYELKGMTKKKRDDMISQIYIALHEQSAKGQTGPGSVAVKLFAAQIASEYIDSAQIVGEDGKSYHLGDIYDEVSMNRFKQELADLLFGEFSNMGKHTSNAEFMAKIRRQNEEFRRERLNDSALIKAAREVSYQAMKLRELAEKQKRDMADDGIQKVTRMLGAVVDPKGNIRIGAVDKAIAEASRFYTMESDKLDSQRSQIPESASITDFAYNSDENMSFMIEELVRLREGREGKALTAEEMKLLGSILRGMKITVERFNKEYVNGHWVEIEKPLGEAIRDVKDFATAEKKYKTGVGRFLGEKIGGAINQAYFYNVLTPETTIETLEGYKKDGLLKTLYHSVRVARQRADHRSVRMKKPFDEFINNKDNAWTDEKGKKRAYREKLNEKTVVVNGNEITLGEGIYLLMLTKREQAHAGLREGGFFTFDENNQHKTDFTISDIEAARDSIYNQLDEVDKRFLSMAEEFFNVTATKVKEDADMEIFGYTNALEKYYVPIIRDRYSRSESATDSRQSIGSIITVYNKSFNQNTVENAKALEGKNIMSIICDHADGLADYAELYLPLKAFDRVYNRAVVLDNGKTTTLRKVLQNDVWNGTEKYLKNLFQDIQGQSRKSDGVIDGLVGKLRSGWVNSVLGLNLKVVATQTTSFVAANQVIEMKYLAPAISKFLGDQSELGERANEYSDIIEARSFDMSALKAQGNIDKVNDLGRKSGFMIEWMDRRVCLAIFHAAELKAQDLTGHAVGTVENARAAAKIADEVIYTTQAMTSQAERSALQRSASEVARTFSMFTADSVKNLSHMYGNVMRYIAHSQRVKNGQVEYQSELAKDRKAVARSATTLVSIGVMLGVITQAFKYLYAKEEEEPEEKAKDFAIDVVSSTFNILPIVSDLADKFVFNYDISLNVFDIVNDTIEDTAGLFGMLGSAMSGKYVSQNEIGKNVINSAKTYATMFGLPLAPLERTVTGLLRRFAPSTVYGYDAMLYNTSYTADLKDAVENGDEALAEHILTQLYKNEVTGVYTSEELGEVARLYQEGHTSVLPQKIGKTINDVTLTKAQRKQFNSIYSQASAKVNSIMRSAEYKALTDEQKAKVIKNTYSLYYNRAAAQVVGAEWTRAQAYSQLTDKLDVLFVTQAYKSGLSAYEGDDGKTVSVKTQFLEYLDTLKLDGNTYTVVAYANGVRDGETTAALLEYINSLGLSDEVKAKVAAALGFVIQDGKLIKGE